MRRTTTSLTLLALLFVSVNAHAIPEGWTADFDAAQKQAKSQDKDLLLDFTGSDWCGWCIRLHDEVFETEAFSEQAPRDFVLVELDFPRDKPQSQEIKQQNAQLAQRYQIQGYPTVILADPSGKPYARTGYQAGGEEAYLEHLSELREKRTARDEAMARAQEAEGIEKAQALDDAMSAVGMELAIAYYPAKVKQIIELDSDNEAGLKSKYEAAFTEGQMQARLEQAMQTFMAGDAEGAIAQVDELLQQDAAPQIEQTLLAVKGQMQYESGDLQQGIAALEQAVQVDPDSRIAQQINAMLERLPSTE